MAVTGNDFRRLKDEANIEDVLNYLQIPIERRGSAYFITCPNPEHADTHATNCYFKAGWNNVYCCACQKSMKAIDIIMWKMGCTYGEAADILWEIEGKPSWYYVDEKKNKEIRKQFRLTREQMELIGIHNPNRLLIPRKMHQKKESLQGTKTQYHPKEIDTYLLCDVRSMNIKDFMTDKQYIVMILNKTTEKIKKLKEQKELFKMLYQETNGEEFQLLCKGCELNIKECYKIKEYSKSFLKKKSTV